MKHKTEELEGDSLNEAVALCGGWPEEKVRWEVSPPCSTDWRHGGPIIERERISTIERGAEGWMADMRGVSPIAGPTPLIAAMRAYVASKLGDEVELP